MHAPKITDPVLETAYQLWLEQHIRARKGERKRRLLNGLGHIEKLFITLVWWPAFGSLEHLYPEYEVYDFKDGSRFLDFAYLQHGLFICIEIDPYGTHYSKISRWQYDDNLNRHNDLMIDGWKILRFSRDQVADHPRHCQQKLQQAFGKWGVLNTPPVAAHPIQHAIIQLLTARHAPLSPMEISRELGWHRSTVSRHLKSLVDQSIVKPVNPSLKRNTSYVLPPR